MSTFSNATQTENSVIPSGLYEVRDRLAVIRDRLQDLNSRLGRKAEQLIYVPIELPSTLAKVDVATAKKQPLLAEVNEVLSNVESWLNDLSTTVANIETI